MRTHCMRAVQARTQHLSKEGYIFVDPGGGKGLSTYYANCGS